jgi:hypothetical protein
LIPVKEGASPRARALSGRPGALALLALLALQLLAGCGAATPEPPVCSGTGVCGAGYCVAGRCRPAEATPAPADARRVVLAPEDVAVLASGGDGAAARAPEAIALGRAAEGSLVLLLRFAATWRDDAEITSAFLVLDPASGAPPAARDVRLEVARVLDPWRSDTATWGRQPRLSIPEAAAVVRRSPAVPLRIDVTAIVRDWARRRPDEHGIALLAPGDDPVGAAYSMGISEGAGPRLEVYLR